MVVSRGSLNFTLFRGFFSVNLLCYEHDFRGMASPYGMPFSSLKRVLATI